MLSSRGHGNGCRDWRSQTMHEDDETVRSRGYRVRTSDPPLMLATCARGGCATSGGLRFKHEHANS